MKHICVILACLASLATLAQVKPRYAGSFEIGMVNGSFQTEGYLHSSHGIQYRDWYAGLGAGLDYYRYRSVPLALDIKKYFLKGNTRPFAAVTAGLNIPWLMESQKRVWNIWGQPPSTPGYETGYLLKTAAGVMLKSKNNLAFSLTAGWSYKTLTERYMEPGFMPGPEPGMGTEKEVYYQLNRVFAGFAVHF